MRVIYDISILGNGARFNNRTGIFRVVESLACRLLEQSDCDVQFSSVKNLRETLAYLRSEFPLTAQETGRGIPRDYHQRLNGLFDSANANLHATQGAAQTAWRVISRTLQNVNTACRTWDDAVNARALAEAHVFHSGFYPLPLQIKKAAHLRRFITIYDMIPVLYPQYFQNDTTHILHEIMASLGPEDHVIAISETTKNDVCGYLKISPERVFVTPLAADSRLFYPCENADRQRQVRNKYAIPNAPYVLTLSTLEPRKNMDHVIRCFARLVEDRQIGDTNLVLAGSKGWDYERIFGAMAAKSLEGRIILAGRVADEDLAALYSGALAFTYMSYYEGFGLPPLEAMQCGTPVITSNTSSLPEVVGDAGVMLAPDDTDGWCQAVLALYRDSDRREEMQHRSLLRAAQFELGALRSGHCERLSSGHNMQERGIGRQICEYLWSPTCILRTIWAAMNSAAAMSWRD